MDALPPGEPGTRERERYLRAHMSRVITEAAQRAVQRAADRVARQLREEAQRLAYRPPTIPMRDRPETYDRVGRAVDPGPPPSWHARGRAADVIPHLGPVRLEPDADGVYREEP